jgi:hypothetical protein
MSCASGSATYMTPALRDRFAELLSKDSSADIVRELTAAAERSSHVGPHLDDASPIST